MKPSSVLLLRIIFWLLNIVIAGMIVFALGATGLFFWKWWHAPAAAGSAHSSRLSWTMITLLFQRYLYTVYFLGIVYILVLLNKAIYRTIHGKWFDRLNLRSIRRIGYLLLLSPIPMFPMILLLFPLIKVFGSLLALVQYIYMLALLPAGGDHTGSGQAL